MKPDILVLYYTQSGQMLDILQHLLHDIRDKANLHFQAIDPVSPFPWPWNAYAFFDAMPETVARVPIPVRPLPEAVLSRNYDLVILGYQPWFLNPSQPITGFLRSGAAARLLKERPVVTIIGCRNMWLNGQEEVKQDLRNAGASLVGNIVLQDDHPNIISTLTVIRWAFKGQKKASGLLPAAGIADHDIRRSSRFGTVIYRHLTENKLPDLQHDLLMSGAINLDPGLILLEQRGIKNFRKFAAYIREKGGPGDPRRRGRVLLFKRLLITAIFILSPLSSLSAYIQLQLKKKRLRKDLEYFKGIGYEPGRI